MAIPKCYECGHQFLLGEPAWAQDWTVIDSEGTTKEWRYTCEDCEAKR